LRGSEKAAKIKYNLKHRRYIMTTMPLILKREFVKAHAFKYRCIVTYLDENNEERISRGLGNNKLDTFQRAVQNMLWDVEREKYKKEIESRAS
jgi:hypothetical protein